MQTKTPGEAEVLRNLDQVQAKNPREAQVVNNERTARVVEAQVVNDQGEAQEVFRDKSKSNTCFY